MISTRTPRRANRSAANSPTGPAPTTRTSGFFRPNITAPRWNGKPDLQKSYCRTPRRSTRRRPAHRRQESSDRHGTWETQLANWLSAPRNGCEELAVPLARGAPAFSHSAASRPLGASLRDSIVGPRGLRRGGCRPGLEPIRQGQIAVGCYAHRGRVFSRTLPIGTPIALDRRPRCQHMARPRQRREKNR